MKRPFIIYCFISITIFSCNSHVRKEPVTVASNGVNIAYTSCGNGDTALLFLHGLAINKEYWEQQVKEFCPRYKVVAIDLPGFGASGKNRKEWSLDAYAEDVKNVIDQLQLKNVIVIGHSMSGDIILKVSNKYPGAVIGIVGIDNLQEPAPPATTVSPQQRLQTILFFEELNKNFDSTVNALRGRIFQPTTPKAIIDRVMNDVFNSDSIIVIKVFYSLNETAQHEQELMQGFSHRLYLVNSDVIPVKSDSLAKYCKKGFAVEYVHATGHYPMIEKPNEFNAALQKVITAIDKEK